MTSPTYRFAAGLVLAGALIQASALTISHAQSRSLPTCDPDNGGLKLPAGFCALVVADGLGTARHLAVAPNGDLYVSLRSGRPDTATRGGVVALRDADGDGRFEIKEPFGDESTTGLGFRNG